MIRRISVITACLGMLSACMSQPSGWKDAGPETMVKTTGNQTLDSRHIASVQYADGPLEAWWGFYKDATLDRLVSSALQLNTLPAEGVAKSGASQASYDAMTDLYQNPKSALVQKIVQGYLSYRYIQNQDYYLEKYIKERTQILARVRREAGGDAKNNPDIEKLQKELSVLERREDDFEGQKANHIKKITSLTSLLPEYVEQVLKERTGLPQPDITPFLASSATLLRDAEEVAAARSVLSVQTQGTIGPDRSAVVIPDMAMNRFFGISDKVFVNSNSRWRVSVGDAAKNLAFDAVQPVRKQAQPYKVFQDRVLTFIMDIEHDIVRYAHLQDQYAALRAEAQKLSQNYKMLDEHSAAYNRSSSSLTGMQDDAYKARLAALKARYEQDRILAQIYGRLGVY